MKQTHTQVSLRFSMGMFAELRGRLLEDLGKEAFGFLFGRMEMIGNNSIIKIVDARFPRPEDYESRGRTHLGIKRQYIYRLLVEMQQRGDVDTVIDVHTHPFCKRGVAFSGVDDRDEIAFHRWLTDILDDIHYASIVLSQSDYSARLWKLQDDRSVAIPATITTQTVAEYWPSVDEKDFADTEVLEAADPQNGFLARSALALGMDTLRQIMRGQSVAIVGVGGLGSVIAENLIHMGFNDLHLIDPDQVEITNLNRIVGAYYDDAQEHRLKAVVVKNHLQRINPKASITTHPVAVEHESVLSVLADADWIIVATDSHSSRFTAQQIALRYAVPLISAGVNISVKDGKITDMSGEVVVARYGDRLCLNCLGRINPTKVAAEQHKGEFIGEELIRRGYVSGQAVKEPAVKTLNAILGAMAVDILLNQYTERQAHQPISVFENNAHACIGPDHDSLRDRQFDCFHCGGIL